VNQPPDQVAETDRSRMRHDRDLAAADTPGVGDLAVADPVDHL
jgi:hypothetical protein